jgi:hypothetical protein
LDICRKGEIDLAKWLLGMKPDIDISAVGEYAFRTACVNGHIEVAKWLLEMKPDIVISAETDGAFRTDH